MRVRLSSLLYKELEEVVLTIVKKKKRRRRRRRSEEQSVRKVARGWVLKF